MSDKTKWIAETTVWGGQAWGVYRFNLWTDPSAPPEMVGDLAERHALEHFSELQPGLTRILPTEKDAAPDA